jgi:hypothetical protein
MTTEVAATPPPAKRRRRHAAIGARIFIGGLSASTALGLMALMASADSGANVAVSAPAQPPVPPMVIVVRSGTDAGRSTVAFPAVAAAPTIGTSSTAPPVASSQSS